MFSHLFMLENPPNRAITCWQQPFFWFSFFFDSYKKSKDGTGGTHGGKQGRRQHELYSCWPRGESGRICHYICRCGRSFLFWVYLLSRATYATREAMPSVPGTRPSVHNGQLLVSTGLHDLDGTSITLLWHASSQAWSVVLGGGVGVGTMLLIEEDVRTTHARTLLKYFAAEGIACSHHVRTSCSRTNRNQMVN